MSALPSTVPPDLAAFWDAARRRIDAQLDRLVPALATPPASLHEAQRYTLLAPGKRVRGVLLLAAADLLRGSVERALSSACAVEMVHAASLILDDLPSMDAATLRRGKAVLHHPESTFGFQTRQPDFWRGDRNVSHHVLSSGTGLGHNSERKSPDRPNRQ